MNLDAFNETESLLYKKVKNRFPLFDFEVIRTPSIQLDTTRKVTFDPVKAILHIKLVTSFGKLPLSTQQNRQNILLGPTKDELNVYQKLGFPDLWKIRKELEKILIEDKTHLNDSSKLMIQYNGLSYLGERKNNGVYKINELI